MDSDLVADIIEGSQNVCSFCLGRKLLHRIPGSLEYLGLAGLGRLQDAIPIALELIEYDIGDQQLNITAINKFAEYRQQGQVPVVFGEVEPNTCIDEQFQHDGCT